MTVRDELVCYQNQSSLCPHILLAYGITETSVSDCIARLA